MHGSVRVPLHVLLFIGIAALACLMPVHNDTWWHLRAGYEMWHERSLMFTDQFSYTAAGAYFWNHSWLAQLLFYPLYAAGGLPLLTLCCAAAVLAAWMLVWRLMRGPVDLRVVLFGLGVAASTTVWSVRPQVFSILGLPVITTLIVRERWRWAVAVMVLWANLHAGMAIGVVVAAAAVLAAVIGDRDRLIARAVGAAAVGAATLVTPMGIRNWTEMLASMARSRANQIQEWQATPLPPHQLIFWSVAAGLVWLALTRWRRLGSPADRVLVVAAALAMVLAARTLRNVPAFMMLACPAVAVLGWPSHAGSTRGAQPGVPPWLGLAAAAAAAITVALAWSAPWPMLHWRPIAPAAASAIRACRPPLYNRYFDGGPLIWFVPEQRVFVDSRQDPFPVSLVQRATRVEATGDYRELFAEWHINCAALPPSSPTARNLERAGWPVRFHDDQWIVLERPVPSSTGATP